MQLRPARVVTVTTQEELDSAFGSADRLIVEGDDALLSYAATKAAGGTGNEVEVEMSGDLSVTKSSPRRGTMLTVVAAVVLIVAALFGAGVYFFVPFPQAAGPAHQYHHKTEPGRTSAGAGDIPADGPVEVGAEGPSEWTPFMWPAVSVVAILALFLIARQAIAGGRNVEISWKVSEKVGGRVVITKVRTPARRQRAAMA